MIQYHTRPWKGGHTSARSSARRDPRKMNSVQVKDSLEVLGFKALGLTVCRSGAR